MNTKQFYVQNENIIFTIIIKLKTEKKTFQQHKIYTKVSSEKKKFFLC